MKRTTNPIISVIIPTYNRASFIGETLDSIIDQSFSNWECIVIDDSSTDYTQELLEFYIAKDSRIKYYSRLGSLPKGANACRNFGFKLASGKFIQWFDSDDLLAPECFQRKMDRLLTSEADACICNAHYFHKDLANPTHIFKNYCVNKDLLTNYLTGKVNINTPVVLWKKEAVNGLYFNENLHRAQELDFHFRVLKNKDLKIDFIDAELVHIRGHLDSITGNFKKGVLKYIKSDLEVRRAILVYMLRSGFSQEEKDACIQLYVPGIRALYRHSYYSELLKELKSLESMLDLPVKYQIWKYHLIKWVFIYKTTGREYRLKKHLFSLSI